MEFACFQASFQELVAGRRARGRSAKTYMMYLQILDSHTVWWAPNCHSQQRWLEDSCQWMPSKILIAVVVIGGICWNRFLNVLPVPLLVLVIIVSISFHLTSVTIAGNKHIMSSLTSLHLVYRGRYRSDLKVMRDLHQCHRIYNKIKVMTQNHDPHFRCMFYCKHLMMWLSHTFIFHQIPVGSGL